MYQSFPFMIFGLCGMVFKYQEKVLSDMNEKLWHNFCGRAAVRQRSLGHLLSNMPGTGSSKEWGGARENPV